jgi:hypothetical protein
MTTQAAAAVTLSRVQAVALADLIEILNIGRIGDTDLAARERRSA